MTSVSNNEHTQDCQLPEEAHKLLKRLENRPEKDILNTEALRIVRAIWPKTFNVSSPKPLKIGIHKDMGQEEQLPAHIISKALRCFTTMDRYLATIRVGAKRVDLKGQITGTVKLREAVDAEIKRYQQSQPQIPTRNRIIIKKIKLMSVNKQPR